MCMVDLSFMVIQIGMVNVLWVIIKNLLFVMIIGFGVSIIDWLMGYLVVLLMQFVLVCVGESVDVCFSYLAGVEIIELMVNVIVFIQVMFSSGGLFWIVVVDVV